MKNIFIILFLVSFMVLSAVDMQAFLAQEELRLGPLIVGSGEGTSKNEADRIALQDLASQIVVKVESHFKEVAQEDGENVKEYCERVVKTYSDVQLNGANQKVHKLGDKFIVYRYISEANKNEIFESRKHQIYEYISEGEKALAKDNITDFLRNYYWALMLLKSHPDAKKLLYYFDGSGERLIHIALPNDMQQILSEINISVLKIESKPGANCSDLLVEATRNGKRVSNLLVNYNDGYGWSEPSKWTNGFEYISLLNPVLKNQKEITFKIDYTFANHSFTGDIETTIDNISPVKLMNAQKRVLLTPKKIKKSQKMSHQNLFSFDKSVKKANVQTINKLITAISNRNLISVKKYFTITGFQQFNALMGYGKAVVIPLDTTIRQVNIANNEIVRSVPMKFSFNLSKEDFTERVNFIFDENGKVDGVSFALSEQACADIINKDFASDQEKAIIINFIEQYKTSYCLKDIDFIKNVFSNDALIIVGKVIQAQADKNNDLLYRQLGQKTVEYVTLNKKEYVERLTRQFHNNEFINIHFCDNSVNRAMTGNSHVYGIQISQYYYSSTYADKGYLFLMFDLNDIDHPKIMVRSWQPEKNPDGSIMGMEDFQWE